MHEDHREEVLELLHSWQRAENILNNASDEDVVECAILDLEAAKKRYIRMIRQIRMEEEAEEQRLARQEPV